MIHTYIGKKENPIRIKKTDAHCKKLRKKPNKQTNKKKNNNPELGIDYHGSDLVQRAHRNLADIIRNVFPGGALRVTGGHALSVPKVFWTGNDIIKIGVSTQIIK